MVADGGVGGILAKQSGYFFLEIDKGLFRMPSFLVDKKMPRKWIRQEASVLARALALSRVAPPRGDP